MAVRNPFEARPVASRRGGPSKPPLSREAIVAEALRLLRTEGLAGMSLRKVATALETGPATLYAYVQDLDELHALVLDQALANVEIAGATGDWRERLTAVLESYGRVLSTSPGLARLAFGTVAVGPNALRITEALLTLLEEGGVDLATAAWAVDLLVLYVTAIVAEHADGLDPAEPEGAVVRAVAGASEQDHPRVHAAGALLFSGTAEERFAWAIDVILGGILQTPRAPRAGSKKSTKARKRSTRGR
ncbi:TetR/AcrR family transcriptional regulator [Nannocystaceae bacterium ST9]